jgi:tetratricopeptide (TPR) repeat protein
MVNGRHDFEGLLEMGRQALNRNMVREAYQAFIASYKLNSKDPRSLSYIGLCEALLGKPVDRALHLCEQAVENNYCYPDLYCNLGRIFLLSGNKEKAFQTFKKGLIIDNSHSGITREIKKMGIRKQPFFTFLRRSNPLNRFAGRLRAMLNGNSKERHLLKDGSRVTSQKSTFVDFSGQTRRLSATDV